MKKAENLRGMQEVEQRLAALAQHLQPHLRGFYLAGDTAIMFRHHHRLSTDLDFFSYRWFIRERRLTMLRQHFHIERVHQGEDNLDIFIEGVKVSLVYFPCRNIEPVKQWQGVRIASDNQLSLTNPACKQLLTHNRGCSPQGIHGKVTSHIVLGGHVHKPSTMIVGTDRLHRIPNKRRAPSNPRRPPVPFIRDQQEKSHTISQRVETKDAVDVAFLHKKYRWNIKQVEKDFEQKFEGQRFALALGALSHFDDYPDLPCWAKTHILNMVKAWRDERA